MRLLDRRLAFSSGKMSTFKKMSKKIKYESNCGFMTIRKKSWSYCFFISWFLRSWFEAKIGENFLSKLLSKKFHLSKISENFSILNWWNFLLGDSLMKLSNILDTWDFLLFTEEILTHFEYLSLFLVDMLGKFPETVFVEMRQKSSEMYKMIWST